MKNRRTCLGALLLLSCQLIGSGGEPGELLREGSRIEYQGRRGTVMRLETLPLAESYYTKLFKFDAAENPKLKVLREEYGLSEVIAPGKDEFEQQILLMDWVHNRFRKFGQPSINARGALEILSGIKEGHTFFCTQYAQLFASAAASLGWVDRVLALRRHQGSSAGGSTEHSTTEIWSNQFRKWVMLDPTSNLYLEKEGIPLNAYEIRQEWFYRGGRDLTFVIGKERRKYRKGDLPIYLKTFAGFGDLKFDPDELDKYGFIGYIPNTDLMDAGFDYGGMFIVKDKLCEGTQWHKRRVPEDPATDPYFPIGQAALSMRATEEGITVEMNTLTPNFRNFEVKIGEEGWKECGKAVKWKLSAGLNRLQARTVNAFGVTGPVSAAEILLE